MVPLGYLSPNHMYGTLLPILFTVFMTTSPQHMQAWSPPLPTAGLRMGEQGAKQRGNKRNLQEEEKAALEKKVRKRKGGYHQCRDQGDMGSHSADTHILTHILAHLALFIGVIP